ncbi:NUDIX domain-containing protein [Nocardioides rubriscoriae]|uniref:NUDIX domain-containing protein n=1 Tax=Nocardioides rubriscoriae TaxID=642762 RepID=UPI001478B021|nr:NUDIX domain-containing protein [Nocardioides rubriscoriae]
MDTTHDEHSLPRRRSCRALLVDGDTVLLARHRIGDGPDDVVWVGPGGGVEGEERLEEALARELLEETGHVLAEPDDARLVWVQELDLPELRPHGWAGVRNHFFLVPVEAFEPGSGVAEDDPGHPDQEGMEAMRWWSLSEMADAHGAGVLFSPRALPTLLRDVLVAPPDEPLRLGL